MITLDSKGNPAKAVYYSHDQLLTLPTVTVKTERDPNTNTPATYTGVYIGDLFEAFGADVSFDVIGTHFWTTTNNITIVTTSPSIDQFFSSSLMGKCPMTGRMGRTEQRLVPTASFTNPLLPWKRSTATSKNREARTRSCGLSLPVTADRWGVSRRRRARTIRKF